MLDIDIQKECGILCSERSKEDAGDYYIMLKDSKSPTRITFMTCCYFVGIDIDERYHSICVSDIYNKHSILSANKITQIEGRCRDKSRLYSSSLIYNIKPELFVNINLYKRDLLKSSKGIANAMNVRNEHTQTNIENGDIKSSQNERIEELYFQLLRETFEKRIAPSYFNIDAAIDVKNLIYNIYSNSDSLVKHIEDKGYTTIASEEAIIKDERQGQIETTVNKELENITKKEKVRICSEIQNLHGSPMFDKELDKMHSTSKRPIQAMIICIQKLYKYYSIDYIIHFVTEINDTRELKNFTNAHIFKALVEEHPFKTTILGLFKLNEQYSKDKILELLNIALTTHGYNRIESERNTIMAINLFFTNKVRRGKDGFVLLKKYYSDKIGTEPCKYIDENVPIKKLIEINLS